MRPKISIVTVCFNSEKTIRGTILSVLGQKYAAIEYIVVDGKSTDGTVDIIKEFARMDSRLRWISESDSGLYDAMNKGISMASGEYVGIINADDFFTDEWSISKIADAFMQNREIDAVYGNVFYVNPDNTDVVVRKYSSAIIGPALFRWGFMPAHATFYCKRELFDKFGNYKLGFRIAADFELLMRYMYVHNIKTHFIPEYLVTMRTGGISTQGLKSRITLNKEIIKACKMNGVHTNLFLLSFKYLIKIFELRF